MDTMRIRHDEEMPPREVTYEFLDNQEQGRVHRHSSAKLLITLAVYAAATWCGFMIGQTVEREALKDDYAELRERQQLTDAQNAEAAEANRKAQAILWMLEQQGKLIPLEEFELKGEGPI